jgi:hypothetical protein
LQEFYDWIGKYLPAYGSRLIFFVDTGSYPDLDKLELVCSSEKEHEIVITG